jgi:hypothetical protein
MNNKILESFYKKKFFKSQKDRDVPFSNAHLIIKIFKIAFFVKEIILRIHLK